MEKLSNEEVSKLKGIEFYSQSIAATFNTSLEEEKTYIVISAVTIGFLFNATHNQLLLKATIFLAIILFSVTLILSTKIFIINRDYLIQNTISKGKDEKSPEKILLNSFEKKLEIYSKINRYSFISAISLIIVSSFLILFIIEPTSEKTEKNNPITINNFNADCKNL